ncbi:aldehyde reductase [Phytoactinopolyspora alkaliphila]|uniref:Aldehyde reductase n=1 Tax=Phytoactinopolyspora alkaliphila TaxID=1783498 RepID=A0A6N9YRB2_9ACTN|nr:aldehyde reductase [Phytoactinopolyspora alkaliphila]NED97368.1 aldehyde reductase [Phytoactinopolyspora alkaliphila]
MGARVLVTGASGFVAGHCVRELLEHGYAVRGTVRDTGAAHKVAHLRDLAGRTGSDLELVAAHLDSDTGWKDAAAGCDYVMHIASPFPARRPGDAQELVRPAVEGTLRVLRASVASGTVGRVVLTSSLAAITSGHERRGDARFTEDDWSVVERSTAYQRSKTLAEQAAWDFVRDLPTNSGLELTVLNPGLALGPVHSPAVGTSVDVVRMLLARQQPGSPSLGFAVVDVRDLAVAHRLAMESPAAAGKRYICAGDNIWMQEIAAILAAEFNTRGYRVPTRAIPNWLMHVMARFDESARLALEMLGRPETVSAHRARQELGWTMRPVEQSVIDTAASLIEHGVVGPRSK